MANNKRISELTKVSASNATDEFVLSRGSTNVSIESQYLTALSSSYALTASYAISSSVEIKLEITSSFAQTASYAYSTTILSGSSSDARNELVTKISGSSIAPISSLSSSLTTTDQAISLSVATLSGSASTSRNAIVASISGSSTTPISALSSSASTSRNAIVASISGSSIALSASLTTTDQAISASVATLSGSASDARNNITNVLSSSYALTASYAVSSSVEIKQEISSSYAQTSTSASYALTASHALNVPATASYAITSSYAISSSHEVTHEISSSYSQTSSYSVTASYALNGGSGGGVTANPTNSIIPVNSSGSFIDSPFSVVAGTGDPSFPTSLSGGTFKLRINGTYSANPGGGQLYLASGNPSFVNWDDIELGGGTPSIRISRYNTQGTGTPESPPDGFTTTNTNANLYLIIYQYATNYAIYHVNSVIQNSDTPQTVDITFDQLVESEGTVLDSGGNPLLIDGVNGAFGIQFATGQSTLRESSISTTSILASSGFTGSLLGTSSYAVTASYALNGGSGSNPSIGSVGYNTLDNSFKTRASNVILSSGTTSAIIDFDSSAIFEITTPTDTTATTLNFDNAEIGMSKMVLIVNQGTAGSGTITLGQTTGTGTFIRASSDDIVRTASITNYLQITCIGESGDDRTFVYTVGTAQ